MKTYVTFVFCFISYLVRSQVPYGNNQDAGKYFKVDDARIYYEIYGRGQPIVLLHGGLFGDISEFQKLIPKLAGSYQVIAIDLRGHGKSDIGERPFTYELLAKDVHEVLKSITKESAVVVGFSDGAITALKFAVVYPSSIKKLVCLGGPLLSPMDYKPGMVDQLKTWTGEFFENQMPDFVKTRKAMMPQPERWNDFVEKLKNAWLQPVYIEDGEIGKIKVSTLMVCGDRDQYVTLENYLKVYRAMGNTQLAIIPNSDHVVLLSRPDLVENHILTFLKE
jgi:pimeloyl-ACP methyl ester carboxylesterase